MTTQKQLLTRREVREQFGLRSLAQWACEGKGPPITKISNRCYYDRSELLAFLAAHRVPAVARPAEERAS